MATRRASKPKKPAMETAGQPDVAPATAGVAVPRAGAPVWAAFLERLCTAVDAHAVVTATDVAGTITYVNDEACRLSGYPRQALVGRNHRLLKSGQHPASFYEEMWRTIAAGRIWRGEICNRARSGHGYWLETTIVPFLDPAGKPFQYIALANEVSHLKEAQAALEVLRRELDQRVHEQTKELWQINDALRREMEERRVATEKIAKSERLYRFLFQSVTDYFYTVEVVDGRAVHTEHAPGCAAVTGYTPEEFQRNPMLWITMVVPEDRAAVEAQARAALQGHTPPALEHRIVTKSGEQRWIRNTVVVRRNEAGAVAFYDGIISDVTAPRQAEQEIRRLNQELEQRVVERTAQLKASNDQFRLLFEHAPVGISWVEWGEPDRYHLNDRFCQIIGLSAREAEKFENIMEATHPDDRESQRALTQELWSGRRDRIQLQKRYVHKDGRVVWANLIVVVLRDERGRISQQFAMIEDITERLEAEERLRRSEQRFRRFVENANEILYSLTAAGRVLYVSPTWSTKLGHRTEDVVDHEMAEFIHPDDLAGFHDFLRQVLEQGRSTSSVEYRALHRDGHYRWHASSGAVYFDEKGEKFYMGVARDISERKRNQEELRAALARREELARIIHRSPSVVVLWRAAESEGWPVEFVSQNVNQFGYSAEEMLAGRTNFVEIVHPEDRPRVVAEVRAHAAAGDLEYSQEYRIIARDGAVHWVDDRTLVRVSSEGNVTHHEGILTDITDRKQAEERDEHMAREVQRHLLPAAAPDVPEIDVDALYVPSRHIGGDYYDFFQISPRRWAFIVADVSGKGASAALVMAACRTALRIEAPRQGSPASLLRAVNRWIHRDMPEGMFISIVHCLLDLDARELVLCRAGHEAPLVVRAADGRAEAPCPSGLALGLEAGPLFDEALEEQTVQLNPGDLLLLYTDGMTETLGAADDEFGRARLLEIVAARRHAPAAEITRAVDAALLDFAGGRPPEDDRTLVVVRLK